MLNDFVMFPAVGFIASYLHLKVAKQHTFDMFTS